MTTCAVNRLAIRPVPIPAECDITHIFSHFAEQPWSILLDSAKSQHLDGRFDIMVADPIATCISKEKQTLLWHKNTAGVTSSDEEPLRALESLINQYIPPSQGSDEEALPFKVGAMGYWGYDLGRQFETLPATTKDEYSAPDMAVGVYSWSLIKDNQQGAFYLCTLDGYPSPSVEDFLALAKEPRQFPSFSLTSQWQGNMDKQQYVDKLQQVHQYLLAGDCYQVNMAQRFSAQYQGTPWQGYLKLRNSNKAPFSAYVHLPEQTVLSISPERFLSLKDNQVQTKPIKGTRPRSRDSEEDQRNIQALQNSEKDRAENLMIVDLLRNDISRTCKAGSVDVPELFAIESFAAVHHLVSTVTGELADGQSGLDLIKNAFPGGSITGAPKIRAMEIIDELEPNRRNIYCGSIGYLGIDQDMDTSICIRTLLCENNTVYCWAGGGIVVDSEAESEYQECFDKISKILPILTGDE